MQNKLLAAIIMMVVALPASAEIPCRRYSSGDMETTEICRYTGQNLEQAYRHYRHSRHEQELLLPSVPKTAKTVRIDSRSATVRYQPQRGKLYITQEFEGGITEITFTRRSKNIEIKTVMSAD